jgi:hypothetical protein
VEPFIVLPSFSAGDSLGPEAPPGERPILGRARDGDERARPHIVTRRPSAESIRKRHVGSGIPTVARLEPGEFEGKRTRPLLSCKGRTIITSVTEPATDISVRRVGLTYALGQSLLPLLDRFAQCFPQVQFQVEPLASRPMPEGDGVNGRGEFNGEGFQRVSRVGNDRAIVFHGSFSLLRAVLPELWQAFVSVLGQLESLGNDASRRARWSPSRAPAFESADDRFRPGYRGCSTPCSAHN